MSFTKDANHFYFRKLRRPGRWTVWQTHRSTPDLTRSDLTRRGRVKARAAVRIRLRTRGTSAPTKVPEPTLRHTDRLISHWSLLFLVVTVNCIWTSFVPFHDKITNAIHVKRANSASCAEWRCRLNNSVVSKICSSSRELCVCKKMLCTLVFKVNSTPSAGVYAESPCYHSCDLCEPLPLTQGLQFAFIRGVSCLVERGWCLWSRRTHIVKKKFHDCSTLWTILISFCLKVFWDTQESKFGRKYCSLPEIILSEIPAHLGLCEDVECLRWMKQKNLALNTDQFAAPVFVWRHQCSKKSENNKFDPFGILHILILKSFEIQRTRNKKSQGNPPQTEQLSVMKYSQKTRKPVSKMTRRQRYTDHLSTRANSNTQFLPAGPQPLPSNSFTDRNDWYNKMDGSMHFTRRTLFSTKPRTETNIHECGSYFRRQPWCQYFVIAICTLIRHINTQQLMKM